MIVRFSRHKKQELSTILGLKQIIFLVNNNGYTIERLILGPGSSYNDINQWRYAEAASFFDTQGQAIAYSVRTEDELEDALAAASDREALVLIELVMSRLDAPGPLVNFAQRCAEFNFPNSRPSSRARPLRLHRWQILPRWRSRTRWPFCRRERLSLRPVVQRGEQIGQKFGPPSNASPTVLSGRPRPSRRTWLIRDDEGYSESTRCGLDDHRGAERFGRGRRRLSIAERTQMTAWSLVPVGACCDAQS
jgi:hypothetical protein